MTKEIELIKHENKLDELRVKKPLIEGYYIERAGGVEIFVKSELMGLMFGGWKRRYPTYFMEDNDILRRVFDLNDRVLVSDSKIPNLKILLSSEIANGIKIKIRGIFLKEEIEEYQSLFVNYSKLLIEKYAEKRGLKLCL
jgi:hypothetical protein